MVEGMKTSINHLLSEYYKNVNEKFINTEKELNAYVSIIKQFPLVQELIDENNRLKFENKKLLHENAQYSRYDEENINLEVNEKEDVSDNSSCENGSIHSELSVGGGESS